MRMILFWKQRDEKCLYLEYRCILLFDPYPEFIQIFTHLKFWVVVGENYSYLSNLRPHICKSWY